MNPSQRRTASEVQDLGKMTLTEIERKDWGDPGPGSTPLIDRVYSLRRKPLAEFRPDDLDHMIAQSVSIETLVPRAMVLLEAKPLLESWAYPGDLLLSVLKTKDEFWKKNRDLLRRVLHLASDLHATATVGSDNEVDDFISDDLARYLNDEIGLFKARFVQD